MASHLGHTLGPGYSSLALHIQLPVPDSRGLEALPGCFHSCTRDCWEPGLEREPAPVGRPVSLLRRGPSAGAWLAAQWVFSQAGFWAEGEMFCEVSSCSCLQTFLCPLFQFHSDNQGG